MNRNYFMLILVVAVFTLVGNQAAAAMTSKQVAVQEQEPYRIFHFVLRGVTPERAEWMAVEAKKAGFNTLQVVITDGVRLDQAPWKPLKSAWSKKQFKDWLEKLEVLGLAIIPEIKLLTHQEKLFQQQQPELMFNPKTYDPVKKEVYDRVFALLNEIISLAHPLAIHIGHDEVAGHRGRPKNWGADTEVLHASLFFDDVLNIHTYLAKKNIQTWMWADMLIAAAEFSTMKSRPLHGNRQGYGKEMRDRLPKDIVLCDWHYSDSQKEFPSLAQMQREGFRVLGATWKKRNTVENFSQYAAKHGAAGMIATTWFHVQKKEWDIVDRIIKESGEIFLKDFPDAK